MSGKFSQMSNGILFLPDSMSDRFWKIICSPVTLQDFFYRAPPMAGPAVLKNS